MKKKNISNMPLGDRMKMYEKQYETEISPESHLCVRIDGHKFSKFTKGFIKPFDFILSEAFRLTTQDLLEEFNAVSAYTQSDEITLVIPSLINTEKHKGTNKPLWKHSYSGRTQKMASLISGFTTMRFNKHLTELIPKVGFDEPDKYGFNTEEQWISFLNYITMLESKAGNAWFDCRIYGVDSDEEAFNSVMFRTRDCIKNSKSMFAQHFCSHKELQRKTGPEQVEYCKEKTGEDWETVPKRYKYGILVKKEKYLKPIIFAESDGTMDYSQNEFVERSKVTSWSECLTTFSDENVKMIMLKTL